MKPVLEVTGLRVERGNTTILRHVDWRVARGEHWVILGANGSGKTTTLHSALHALDHRGRAIHTLEDPVEYEFAGIRQTEIREKIGLTFAGALRALLRQNPDILLVGETRDAETAQLAVRAALTGHLVLSTLHTNDSAGAVTRLVDMGVEPFLIASSLEAVLAQRLVRRVCVQCRTPYTPPPDLLKPLAISADSVGDRQFFYGKGCPTCSQSGYRGRLGIYEWLRMSEALRDLIGQRASTLVIRQKAIEQGMRIGRASCRERVCQYV